MHLHVPPGELHFIAHSPDSWYNLPRAGGVAYAAQESWVQNETIRVSGIAHFYCPLLINS